ncbi:MAG: caspase family protein [Gammaproteobacteria bacterium]|nr:caspase family protein [Gammaproteobacteria bacterium]
MANKKALLIGINRYKIPGADLRGCVNDVRNMQSVLTKYFGFGDEGISLLTDYDATKKAIQAGILKLLKGAKSGDVLLLHYSGHGANVPDKSGDEADHRDEILCPTDLNWYDPLLDDWLRATFDKLAAGVNLTVIMDCCHSGSNTRAFLPPDAPSIPRFLPCPLDLMAAESGRRLRGKTRSLLRRSNAASRRKNDIVNVDIPELLITGCRDTQTSADAYIKGSYNGALTYNLVASIRAARGRVSYRGLHDNTTTRLETGKFDQVPQLEGRSTHFDARFLAPLV